MRVNARKAARRIAQKASVFHLNQARMPRSHFLETTMFELLKSLVFAVVMVPVVMAIILGLIYGLGEVFNVFSGVGRRDQSRQQR
jgi:hypothetical protein